MEAARVEDFTSNENVVSVAFELSASTWKIGVTDGRRAKPTIYTVSDDFPSSRLMHAWSLVMDTLCKWGVPKETKVVAMYEAGQDGFWIARAMEKLNWRALVVDPASIPVERQARRAKTDRLDVIRLLSSLQGWLRGERSQMHVVHIPHVQAEAERQLSRERGQLQKEVEQHRDRMRKLLRTVGCWEPVGKQFAKRLAEGTIRCFDGTPLPAPLLHRFTRECERLAQAEMQLAAVENDLRAMLPAPVQERIAHLSRLKGVGATGARRLVLELFWRRFDNRRQVGACVGLVPQPYDSGNSRVDQGISKQGNRRVRALLVEMAWFWLRYQPDSTLARWFARRTAGNASNKRGKRIAIVAVARKLTIALWRYLNDGVIPAGATLKA